MATTLQLRNQIMDVAESCGLADDCYGRILDYTINLFESRGLGGEYYGYHNINHDLEVAYVALLVSKYYVRQGEMTEEDIRYLFIAALLHDFDPDKRADKPHEADVIKFITTDEVFMKLFCETGLEIELINALILRTAYPWTGRLRTDTIELMDGCFGRSGCTGRARQHMEGLGEMLSVIDRISGYSLGDFARSMELAQMNAHAAAWPPSVIVRRSVAYFEELLNGEANMTNHVLRALPYGMRRRFFDTVKLFMDLRQREIGVQAEYVFENLKLVTVIEKADTRDDAKFIRELLAIYDELPRPLQFARDKFEESVRDKKFIMNTLRLDSANGEIIGFAKGGPLEEYALRTEIKDQNYGLGNTVFLEPIALKMGYWGMNGGSEMRHMFVMQAHSMKFKYLTSFALRDVIQERIRSGEGIEFVAQFDPERLDYYRISI